MTIDDLKKKLDELHIKLEATEAEAEELYKVAHDLDYSDTSTAQEVDDAYDVYEEKFDEADKIRDHIELLSESIELFENATDALIDVVGTNVLIELWT